MEQIDTPPGGRMDRRRARTRAALVAAAKQLMVDGRGANATIQQITDAADVGFGSFYNHFTGKEELFEAATSAVLEEWGQLIDAATHDLTDPAERFAASFRISARLAWTHPMLSDVLDRHGLDLLTLEDGLAPRAARDIHRGIEDGRFTVAHVPLALSTVGGSLLGFLRLRSSRPELVAPHDVEVLTHGLLCLLGVGADEAERICRLPLPSLDADPTTGGRT